MTRRSKKNESLLVSALEEGWQFSTTIGTLIGLVSLVAPALVNDVFLTPVLTGLQPMGLVIAGIFLLIALFKFIKEKSGTPHNSLTPPTTGTSSKSTYKRSITKAQSDTPKMKHPQEWSLKIVQDLEWKLFEELCVAIYNEKGMKAKTTKLGADGGVDIKLYQENSSQPYAIAQCKAWRSKVGVKPIREFLGVMVHEKVSKGFYLTPSDFTSEAKAVASANSLTLFNGKMVLMTIKRLPQEAQDKLLAMVTRSDYTTPSCPKCGIKMIRRQTRKDDKPDFWGCANFPKCKQTLRLRVYR